MYLLQKTSWFQYMKRNEIHNVIQILIWHKANAVADIIEATLIYIHSREQSQRTRLLVRWLSLHKTNVSVFSCPHFYLTVFSVHYVWCYLMLNVWIQTVLQYIVLHYLVLQYTCLPLPIYRCLLLCETRRVSCVVIIQGRKRNGKLVPKQTLLWHESRISCEVKQRFLWNWGATTFKTVVYLHQELFLHFIHSSFKHIQDHHQYWSHWKGSSLARGNVVVPCRKFFATSTNSRRPFSACGLLEAS